VRHKQAAIAPHIENSSKTSITSIDVKAHVS